MRGCMTSSFSPGRFAPGGSNARAPCLARPLTITDRSSPGERAKHRTRTRPATHAVFDETPNGPDLVCVVHLGWSCGSANHDPKGCRFYRPERWTKTAARLQGAWLANMAGPTSYDSRCGTPTI